MTSKQQHFVEFVRSNPGVNTHQLHRAIGRDYAHGATQFAYKTVDRLLRPVFSGRRSRGPLLKRGKSANGRGVGLYPAE